MGGKNIIMVMDDARLDLAVDGAVWGGFGTTGQRCTAASRVAVHKKVYKEFIERFVARAKALKVGNGLDDERADGPLRQREPARARSRSTWRSAKDEGAKLLTRRQPPRPGATTRAGFFHEPTIFGDCSPKMRIARRRSSARWSR